MFLVCVRSVVVTFTWPEWNMFLITAYGRSPGDLLRVMRWFRLFLGYLVDGLVLRVSWLHCSLCMVFQNMRGLGMKLPRVLLGLFDYHELILVLFRFLLLIGGLCPFCCVVCSRNGIFHSF